MGCNTSKVDRLPAVALCRERCEFLDEALSQSYALADAHATHVHSLRTLPSALLCFFQHFQDSAADDHTIPQINKDDAVVIDRKKPSPPCRSPSSSSSSEAEAESRDKEIQLFTHQSHYGYLNHDIVTVTSLPPPDDDLAFMHYVKLLHSTFSPPPPNHYGGYNSGEKPPSPPQPPRSSAWDFLNFFEPYERYQFPYSPSREIEATEEKKKKEEETVLKGKVMSDVALIQKGDGGKGMANEAEKGEVENKELVSKKEEVAAALGECSNSTKLETGKGLCETVKEIQILFERASDSGNPILEMLDVGKLRYHKKIAFNPSYPGSSYKMINVFTPSIRSNHLAVKCMEKSLIERRAGSGYGNLCSTLKSLCVWEKKLYREVKAEEKLRILHQKKCRQLRRMSKKGADAQKIDSVRTFIGLLATKMKISIHVVDNISNTISKLREEELWPQIKRFILMFLGMWKDMQECYRCQYEEIAKVTPLDASAFNMKHGKSHIDATMKLKSELQNWNLSFSDWIHAQKCYVKALNGWLVRCLLYEPEELSDDATPFSPGKIGAPPVFVICNKWSRALDNLSEKTVTKAVSGFMLRLNELLEKHILELQQKSTTLDKELERKVKILGKQEQKMHKIVQARERKMDQIGREESEALLRGDGVVHQGGIVDNVSLESSLKEIFSAMERFTATTVALYQELCQQINHVSGESKRIH